jgi:hypothetical protein
VDHHSQSGPSQRKQSKAKIYNMADEKEFAIAKNKRKNKDNERTDNTHGGITNTKNEGSIKSPCPEELR